MGSYSRRPAAAVSGRVALVQDRHVSSIVGVAWMPPLPSRWASAKTMRLPGA
jgi:hypothetical protein